MHNRGLHSETDAMGQRASRPTYQFGPFELDLGTYELRRGGRRLRLARAPMDLLVLLVEQHGSLVKREEIAARLWPQPLLVDVDQGINTAMRRIREVLLDDPAKPRFVETVIGRGYRFIAEVSQAKDQLPPPTPLIPAPGPSLGPEESKSPAVHIAVAESAGKLEPKGETGRKHRAIGVAAVVTALLVVALGGLFALWRRQRPTMLTVGSLVQVTTNDSEQRVTAAAISPDGKWLAYADVYGMALKVLQSGEVLPLHAPTKFRAERIAWFPNQLRMLVSGFTEDNIPQIWTVYVTGPVPQLFRDNARNGVPSPNGTQVAFTVNHDAELWLAGVDGEGSRPLIGNSGGQSFSAIFWSANGKRVSYLLRTNAIIGGVYGSADAGSGKVLASQKGVNLDSASSLPDDRLLFLGAELKASGAVYALWQVKTDPVTGSFSSAPVRVANLQWGRPFSLTTSADGSEISAVIEKGQPHVYVGDLQRQNAGLDNVHRLTFDTRTDYPHAWLHDNQTVIFESDRTGTYRIYKQHLQERTAQEFSTGTEPAVLPQMTPDGNWILYAAKPSVSPSSEDKLFRISVQGGVPIEVPVGGPLEEFLCPLSGISSCVIRDARDGKAFIFYALDPLAGKGRELARTAWLPHVIQDWCVSPDGSSVALTSHQSGESEIRIVALGNGSAHRERELKVKGFARLSGISWSADGRGWYVAADNGMGTSLLYVSLNGEAHTLLATPGSTWGVPSPDGHKLAFVDQAVDSNVWLWQK